ncbi:hypothetical protein B0F90DRAFT_1772586 [Multifurca ochricompacta]|uniref:Uncharacterized protein n=1 Tax=Multifurca ochricompacta TaxID=376703 RepID=A0AAD4LXX7_9AGAM|nr:hypothetical protein B0F90DRAFT_1772586 [Multifurca ochricompacta]
MGYMLLAAAALALPPIPSIHSKNISKSTLSALWIVFLTTLTMQPAQPHASSPRFLRHRHLLYYISSHLRRRPLSFHTTTLSFA